MHKFLFLLLLLTLLAVSNARGADRFAAATWASVQSLEVPQMQNLREFKVGQLVEIKFNYRHKKIRHLKPGWYQGSLWGAPAAGKKKPSYVQVMVSKAALPAFEAISSDHAASGGNNVAYGQVLQDAEANKFRFVRLLGTKVERDAAGNATVSW